MYEYLCCPLNVSRMNKVVSSNGLHARTPGHIFAPAYRLPRATQWLISHQQLKRSDDALAQ